MSDDPPKVPKPTGGDAAVAILRAGVGSIPLVGAAAAELFSWFVKAPLENRRDGWMKQVGEILEELQMKRGIDLESLQKDEAFVDVVMQATHTAMQDSQEEKREALRNAIVNSGLPHPSDESKRQMFLYTVDVMTVWHIRILKLFADPQKWFADHNKQPPSFGMMSSLDQVLVAAFPELAGDAQREFRGLVWKDSYDLGLHRSSGLFTMMTANGAWAKRLSPFGEELLAFISDPKQPKGRSEMRNEQGDLSNKVI